MTVDYGRLRGGVIGGVEFCDVRRGGTAAIVAGIIGF
jgi:hypothetical protein